jgi:hypothetical protein
VTPRCKDATTKTLAEADDFRLGLPELDKSAISREVTAPPKSDIAQSQPT